MRELTLDEERGSRETRLWIERVIIPLVVPVATIAICSVVAFSERRKLKKLDRILAKLEKEE